MNRSWRSCLRRARLRLRRRSRSLAASGRDRVLALLLLLPAAGLLYGGTLHWYVALRMEQGDRIEALQQQLAQYRRQAARLEAMRGRLEELQRSRRDHPYLLPQSSANLALAELGRRVEQAAAGTEPAERACRVRSTDSRGRGAGSRLAVDETLSGFEPVGLRVELDCGIHGVADVLPALESEPPYLLVDEFRIRRTNRTELRGEIQPARLHMRFTLTGYLLSDAAVGAGSEPGDEARAVSPDAP